MNMMLESVFRFTSEKFVSGPAPVTAMNVPLSVSTLGRRQQCDGVEKFFFSSTSIMLAEVVLLRLLLAPQLSHSRIELLFCVARPSPPLVRATSMCS